MMWPQLAAVRKRKARRNRILREHLQSLMKPNRYLFHPAGYDRAGFLPFEREHGRRSDHLTDSDKELIM